MEMLSLRRLPIPSMKLKKEKARKQGRLRAIPLKLVKN
jgi:hypothetical protein